MERWYQCCMQTVWGVFCSRTFWICSTILCNFMLSLHVLWQVSGSLQTGLIQASKHLFTQNKIEVITFFALKSLIKCFRDFRILLQIRMQKMVVLLLNITNTQNLLGQKLFQLTPSCSPSVLIEYCIKQSCLNLILLGNRKWKQQPWRWTLIFKMWTLPNNLKSNWT